MSGPVAAIDCGTNSTRLLVAGPDGNPLERLMRITRLGQGVDLNKALAPEAIERTVSVLREYREVIDRLGVERIRMIATSAARDAANREDFFAAAEAAIGVRPELLDGDEEGRLSFKGATASLNPDDGPFLVVDIGGGSTEFAVGGGPDSRLEPTGVVSIDVGCVRVTERFLQSDPPRPEELSQALSVVRDHLDDVRRELPASTTQPASSAWPAPSRPWPRSRSACPPTTRSDPPLRPDPGSGRGRLPDLGHRDAASDRIHNPGLEEARADVIVGGCVVLVAIMRHFEFDECLVSEADILDGLAATLL